MLFEISATPPKILKVISAMRLPLIAAALIASTALSAGCTPVGVAAGAGAAGGAASTREGGIKGTLEDTRIRAAINDAWFKYNLEMFSKVNLTVDQGRVLLTGVVQKQQHRVEAVRLAWQVEGVKQVINEIKIADSEGVKGWGRDVWIASRLRSSLLFDKDIQSVNYSIDVVQAIVYVMGISQTQAELDKVMQHARMVPYVLKVVSYVKMAGAPIDSSGAPVGGVAPVGVAPVGGMQPVQPLPVTNAPVTTTTTTAPVSGGYGVPSPPPVSETGVGVGGRPQPIVDPGF